jgi:hypothetical protein
MRQAGRQELGKEGGREGGHGSREVGGTHLEGVIILEQGHDVRIKHKGAAIPLAQVHIHHQSFTTLKSLQCTAMASIACVSCTGRVAVKVKLVISG